MRRHGWLWLLIVLVLGVTLWLAIAKVRSPQVRFDRTAIGMPESDLDGLLGSKPELEYTVMRGDESLSLRIYTIGMFKIEVHGRNGVVEKKHIHWLQPQVWPQGPATKPTSTAKMPPPPPPPPPK